MRVLRAHASSAGNAGAISIEELQLATRNHGMPLEQLRDLPSRSITVTMECAGNGRSQLDPRPLSQPWIVEAVSTATWTGVPLRAVLDETGILDDAVELLFTGLDRGIDGVVDQQYERSLAVHDRSLADALLAYEMNGAPLLPQHGFPLRLVVPGWYGMTNVKWLQSITALAEPFDGFQQSSSYRFRATAEDPGTPVTRVMPRSLLVSPGVSEFYARRRHVAPGVHVVRGRAWSGQGPIAHVEVSDDGAASWSEAALDAHDLGPWAWRGWSWSWDANAPGEYELCCRAIDEAGNRQPLDARWNQGGDANNAVHRVTVVVDGPS